MHSGLPAQPNVKPVHAMPGRARVHVNGLRARPDLKNLLEAELSRQPGIRSVTASAVTSNLLVYYDPGRDLPDVVGIVKITFQAVALNPPPRQPWTAPPEPAARQPLPAMSRGMGVAALLRELLGSLAALRRAAPPRTMTARDLVRLAAPERMSVPWHAASTNAVIDFWRTSDTAGIDTEEARRRLLRYGPNVLPHPEPRSAVRVFAGQLKSLPVLLLAASAAASLALGAIADAVAISAVIFLNAVIGASTELDAEKTLSALMTLSEPIVSVLRDGDVQQIGGEHVVPGDILILSSGSHVAGDARLVASEDLLVDESALTGESMPVEKSPAALDAHDAPLGERSNIVHRGTVVSGGSGVAVVFSTGRHTEIGGVQALMNESAQPETPLQRQMRQLGNQLLWFTAGISGVVFAAGVLRGVPALRMLRTAISVAVAAVPEGLPTVATVSLASGVRSLARRQALVRRLEAVEALGAVQVVCFDKTGTLTLNRMSPVAAFAGMREYDLTGGRFLTDHRPVHVSGYPELTRLLEICALCSEAELDAATAAITGTPTEAALLQMAVNGGIDVARLRRKRPVVHVRRRANGQNYMATTHDAGNGTRIVAVKGNPSEVLRLCDRHLSDGTVRTLSDWDRRLIKMENERMAGAALRVLGAAFTETDADQAGPPEGLIWTGLVGIADPPRQGLREVIADFRRAGIRPVMLTGDQRATAHAIGRALDLNGGGKLEALDSRALDQLERGELSEQIGRVHIFSRVNPAQKLQIVRGFQRGGTVVAMTGDGVNDGPALKAADVGIALGQSGTRVARQVADIVLMDDNLQSLLPAISEGRRVRNNVRTAIHYMAATNLTEILVVLGGLAAGIGEPLSARQLLWINFVTDVFPELALAVGPADPAIMSRPPDNPYRPMLGRSDFAPLGACSATMAAAAMAAYGYAVARHRPSAIASTMAFLTVTSSQLLLLGSTGSRTAGDGRASRNPYMVLSMLAGFGALALSQFGLTGLLGTARLGLADAAVCAGASLGSLIVNNFLRRPRPETSVLADDDLLASNVAAGLQVS